ncbi:hypothetical protein CDL15_Pgr009505 [Punica granatum]|uniref:Uncharacterized protein n=1 Tax=Punica granatum TaxID=22663 RepID=A0A218WUH6_PUNGR|nr:hypothetical protein CDL15_Pgr009505 [Punica granatum]
MSLIVTPPQNFVDPAACAHKFITLEESLSSQSERAGEKRKDHPGSDRKEERRPPPQFEKFTPLNSSKITMLYEIEHQRRGLTFYCDGFSHLPLGTMFLAFYTEDTMAFAFYNEEPLTFYYMGIPHIRLGTTAIVLCNSGSWHSLFTANGLLLSTPIDLFISTSRTMTFAFYSNGILAFAFYSEGPLCFLQ